MALFETIIGLLLAAALLTALAHRLKVPAPALLALGGLAAAFIPGVPLVTIDPQLALALFVAPVLLDAAFDASPRDLRDNLVPVATLALVAVGITIAAVAVVARWVLPEIPWAAAIALGAIVAPPDAAAATAVLRRLNPPHRIMVILEGESLFNDASALLVFRLALAAAATGSFSLASAVPMLLVTAVGGAALGWAAARLYFAFTRRVSLEMPISVILQFLGTFGVWILAEALHVSAIITVVAYGMTLARHAPRSTGARRRIASYAVWEVAVFVLNALAFLLIGLEMRVILGRLDGAWEGVALLAAGTCLAVILARLGWVMAYNAVARLAMRRFGPYAPRGRPLPAPTVGGGLLISWSGMRGIVTLATALALPEDFPFRDPIVFAAVCVVLVTLVVQGSTIGPLLRRLGLSEDDTVEAEVRLARLKTSKAAMRALEETPASSARDSLLREMKARAKLDEEGIEAPAPDGTAALQGRAVEAARDVLEALRQDGTIGDDAFHVLEEELDLMELAADPRVRPV
ncbi:cation:proton antiporter [Pararoseomonas indoligenes]|uniref:Sodium:proton antiporter n=1 Tax=Roseomonas indoligenes TaxID=2820811 RepID=A0A940MTG5_9PROT|nr:sodium:proton antiporter [Pararoseomonas indoligenes]MBP0491378.1 sodium:proton antiporter [Pararoseomonas indoligenes]